MKKQEFISYLVDKEGKKIDFERWACKKVSTVINNLKKLYTYSIYKKDIERSEKIVIYKTPDGYTKEEKPTIEISIKELLTEKAI